MATLTHTRPARPQLLLPSPHAGQRAVRTTARRFNFLAAGRRWRKSTHAMAVAIEGAAVGQRIVWGAPVFDQVRLVWDEACNAAGGVASVNQTRMAMRFPSGGVIVFRSLDNPDNARGHAADGVVVDEAADVKEEAWYEVLRPMLIDTNGWAWILGTPKGRTWFWQEHERARTSPDSMAWQIPTLGCVIEDGVLVRRPHPLENPNIPFSELEELFATMPEAAFRQEILAEFISSAFDIFDRVWFAERRFNPDDGMATKTPQRVLGRYLSWDTALKDTDTSAYSACVVGELLDTYELRIVDVWRDRCTFPNLLEHMARMKRKHNTDGKLLAEIIEDKVSGTSAYQTLVALAPAEERDRLVAFQPQGSKEQRASQAAVWCKSGMVWLPIPGAAARWLLPFEDELFQTGQFLDQRDAFAQLLLYLEHLLSAGFHARGVRAATERTEA